MLLLEESRRDSKLRTRTGWRESHAHRPLTVRRRIRHDQYYKVAEEGKDVIFYRITYYRIKIASWTKKKNTKS